MPPYQNGQNNQGSQGVPQQPSVPNPYEAPQPQPQPYGPPQQPQAYGPQPSMPAPAAPYVPQQPVANQPLNQPVPDDPNNRYDFFLNPDKPRRSAGTGGLFVNKLLLVAAAGISLVVVVIAIAVISAGNKPNTAPLLSLAQTQQEVIRVAADGVKNAQDQNLINFSVNTVETVSSAQTQLLPKVGIKSSDKQLALGHSAATDKDLAAALAASTYDSTYKTIMQSDLTAYLSKIDSAAAATPSRSVKALLKSEHDGATLLQTQLNQ